MIYRYPGDYIKKELYPGVTAIDIEGELMMIRKTTLEPGSYLPYGTYPREKMGYVVEGKLTYMIGDECRIIEAGHAFLIPPDTGHGGFVHDRAAILIEAYVNPGKDGHSNS